MNKIPFSVYDFFGYLSSGFILLAAVDFAFMGGTLLRQKLDGFSPVMFFWLVLVYVLGHLVANVASFLLETKAVRGRLGAPEDLLFQSYHPTLWSRIFPGYFAPLPKHTRERVIAKAHDRAGIAEPGRALFFHCHPIVKREQVTLERLNNFLNAYGFCRNMSLVALTSALIVLVPVIQAWCQHRPSPQEHLWWAVAGVLVSVGMFYRFLKFFRLYTTEVFITYAEIDRPTEGKPI